MSVKRCDLGLLQMQILWLLSKKPSHGYDLMKTLNKIKRTRITQSTMYPCLAKLESMGLVKSKASGSRGRKTYVLSAKGRKTLAQSMKEFCACFEGIFKDVKCVECGCAVCSIKESQE